MKNSQIVVGETYSVWERIYQDSRNHPLDHIIHLGRFRVGAEYPYMFELESAGTKKYIAKNALRSGDYVLIPAPTGQSYAPIPIGEMGYESNYGQHTARKNQLA